MSITNIVLLGSTGSIGEQTLEIVREHPDCFKILALSCNQSWDLLAAQIKEFKPCYAFVGDEVCLKKLQKELHASPTKLLHGTEALRDLATLGEADIVLNALVGFAGFEPTVAALKAGKKVALANKESLVVGGALIRDLLEEYDGQLLPVDSEHSAIFQCLVGENHADIEKLIITASGGPFLAHSREQMKKVTVAEALNHPNWAMGAKITIDSATMMNKGLEVIEAHWLFGVPLSKIEAVIHPQSIVHSAITFTDGSTKAQLGPPTMKVPILYALSYPHRIKQQGVRLNWEELIELSFRPVNHQQFPCFKLALDAMQQGGYAPAALNAANEVAVQRFLDEEISYIKISSIIEECLSALDWPFEKSVQAFKNVDTETRQLALTL